uniref:TENS3 protein n=1 Tax=Macrostomum lignano TaxID=282301 RepID=A0A1I8G2Z2_9PLAT
VTPKLRRPNHAGSPTGAQHLGASDTLRSRGSESADSVFDERHVNANTLMRSDSYNKYTTSVDYLEDEMLYTTTKLGDAVSVDETTHDIEKIGTLSSQKDNVAMEQIEPSSYMSQYREPEALTPPENYITGKDNVAPQRIPVVS